MKYFLLSQNNCDWLKRVSGVCERELGLQDSNGVVLIIPQKARKFSQPKVTLGSVRETHIGWLGKTALWLVALLGVGQELFQSNDGEFSCLLGLIFKKYPWFVIRMNTDLLPDLNSTDSISVFCHEMVHIKQIYRKELVGAPTGKVFNNIFWTADEVRLCQQVYGHDKLPWEIEAYKKEDEILQKAIQYELDL